MLSDDRTYINLLITPLFWLYKYNQSFNLLSASVWSVQFAHFLVFCSSYSRCPRAQSFVKVWARARALDGVSVTFVLHDLETRCTAV